MKHQGALVFFYAFFDYVLNVFVSRRIHVRLEGFLELAIPCFEIS